MTTTTFKECDQCRALASEIVRVPGQILCPDYHDANLVFCQLCGVAGFSDPTQDWTCKDCMDQAIIGFDD
jgi:hypothetical protein